MKKLLGLAGSGLGAVAGVLGINRAWLTLLGVAIIAAGFYVAWARTNANLARRAAWIDVACASAGRPWAAVPGSKLANGAACQAEIAALARYRADAARLTAEALAAAAATRDSKMLEDTAATRRAAEDARAAAQSMETANEDLKDDRVSGAWFDAFNRTAGLRTPAS
jgi:hypothetical protein